MASTGLIVIAMLLVAGSVGGAAGIIAANGHHPSPSLTTVTGDVTSVVRNPHFNTTLVFQLNSNGTNYTVVVGPPWYWAEHNYTPILVNETVKVTGLAQNSSIQAWTLWINGGPAIVLRTGGMPAWAQERSGQTGA